MLDEDMFAVEVVEQSWQIVTAAALLVAVGSGLGILGYLAWRHRRGSPG